MPLEKTVAVGSLLRLSRRAVSWSAAALGVIVYSLSGVPGGPVAQVEAQEHERRDLEAPDHEDTDHVHFTLRSARNGRWSDPTTWSPPRVPGKGDRVLVSRGTRVVYDAKSDQVIRLIQVNGTLTFARDRDTLLEVGIVKVQNSDICSESGFACDFHRVTEAGEPGAAPSGDMPVLEIGRRDAPIPAEHTARIRLHYLEGMNKDDAPAIACCSARMEIHGSPIGRTWAKLGLDAEAGDTTVVLSEPVEEWRVGDEVIITVSERKEFQRTLRGNSGAAGTEERRVTAVDGPKLTLDRPLDHEHYGSGEFQSEVANLTRSVVIESADPGGIRGHTVYHRFSRGSISYARFTHLGKAGVLGRYSIHFHLVRDTMRGSSVVGAVIVDSHNRWITIHGTDYLLVRDCVGYGSLGHGFFLEDGTEVYNVLDRNLGVQAYRADRLPRQALPFDPNDGAAFWWANGRNTIVRNVACESDHYGFRYDMQKTSGFDTRLPIPTPGGEETIVDVRTVPIWRFEGNEAHGNFAGMVVAANGGQQPDTPIRDQRMLERIRSIDWTGPDTRHPHVIRHFKIWDAHYAFRPHSPAMLMDGIRIHGAAYGIYRPAFENHVYRNVHLTSVGPEPFNRGMDDASAQNGSITVDGLIVDDLRRGNDRHPVVHMTDNALADGAACHFRNVVLERSEGPRPLFNRGGSVRADPIVGKGVPYYIHDYFGPGRDAKIVSTKARHLLDDGNEYREERPLTGDASRVAEVAGVEWPKLLDPVDDVPPATTITSVHGDRGRLTVRGVSHDNGDLAAVWVNGQNARTLATNCGVVDWEVEIAVPADGKLVASAKDKSGNVEKHAHQMTLRGGEPAAIRRPSP